MIKANKTKANLIEEIDHLANRERNAKAVISDLAKEVLAHAIQHGDISLVNAMVKALTPANRRAVVDLVKHCTLFVWDYRSMTFKGKDKQGDKREKDLALSRFITIHNGNLWHWYESVKMIDRKTRSFSRESLVKMILAYAVDNNESFDGIISEFNIALVDAEKLLNQLPLIEKKTAELVGMGFCRAEAKKLAQKLAKERKL